MATLDFRILGPFEVRREDAVVQLPGRKPRALLACLVVNAGSTVSQDRLIDAVWGEEPPRSAVNTLHTYISHLRTALEPARADADSSLLATDATGYRLEVPDDAIDARRLEAAVADGLALLNRGRAQPAAEAFERGLRWWRGPALEDFLDADFARPEATRLDELRQVAAESRAEALLTIGDDATVVAETEALVTEYPLREGLWRHLMLALYRSGRQADALRAFERYRNELGEIGLEPSEELRDLEDGILMRDPILATAPGGIAGAGEREIPQPLTSFVGREAELAEVADLLDRTRLVTVTGIGGIGKSRLAIEAGRAAAASLDDGGRYIDLAEVTQPELAESAFAEALGIAEAAGRTPLQLIEGALKDRSMVLVVDNAEEVASQTGVVLGAILAGAPDVVAIVASRQQLGAEGETTFVLGPLSDGVRLFEARAGAVSTTDRDLVSDICRAVNGIPAAIELVAARTRMLTVEEIAGRLDEVVLATDESRQALPVVLAWTYDSLSDDHQRLLRRLSVFSGGFTFDALVAVTAPEEDRRVVLSQLGELIDQALVSVAAGTPSRYSMLEVFRGELGSRLGDTESDRTNAAHAEYYAGLAEELEASFATERWQTMVQRIDAEDGNLRQALEWAIDRDDPELASRLAGPLGRYWRWRDRAIEGAQWVDAVLAMGRDAPGRAKVLREAAGLYRVRGDLTRSVALATEALQSFADIGDEAGRADALYDLGLAGIFAGDFDTAGAWFAEAAAIWEQLERPALMAFPLIPLAWLRQIRGDYDTAEDLWTTILAGVDTARFPEHSGITFRLADLALDQGQVDRAEELAASALTAAVDAGYPYHEAGARSVIARLRYYAGDLQGAATEAAAALEAARDSGNVEGIGFALRRLAWVALRRDDEQGAARFLDQSAAYGALGGALSVALLAELAAALLARLGRLPDAAGLFAAAEQARELHRLPLPAPEAEEVDRELAHVRAELGDQAFGSAQETGRSWEAADVWRLIKPTSG